MGDIRVISTAWQVTSGDIQVTSGDIVVTEAAETLSLARQQWRRQGQGGQR
jgi:hypothetical protein